MLSIILVPLLSLVIGCEGLVYVLHLAEGQLGINTQTEAIDTVLASGRLSDTEQDKLELIVAARQYAVDTIGLNGGTSYTTFFDTEGSPLAFNLSAARRDALKPMTWTFPIIGEVPYLTFFDENMLDHYEQQLTDAGNDTLTYELDAYSTLGFLEDPVRSPMLARNEISLVETIIHELLHNTIYRANATTFNESLATFVGRKGAVEFLRQHFGDESTWPAIAVAYYADTDAVNGFLIDLHGNLATYYAQPLDKDERIAGREAVFQAARDRFVNEIQPTLNYPITFGSYADLPTNNAWVLAYYRYNLDLTLFEDVYDAVDNDWTTALGVYRDAARATGDPFEYLRTWLANQ